MASLRRSWRVSRGCEYDVQANPQDAYDRLESTVKKIEVCLAASLAIGGASLCTQVLAAELGDVESPIKLAVNEWTGQHVTTHIAGEMLKKAGYEVEYVTAGYMNMYQAMADGEIHAAMEIWSSNVSEQYGKMKDAGELEELSDLGLEAREGFAYPAHVAELCPGLPAWEALKECAPAFATAETIPAGRLVDYPADWGTPGADRVSGLELPFKAVPAGSEGALVTEIRASTEKKSPLLVVFWQPHWAMSAFDLQFVDLPPGEPACFEDPAWGPNANAVNDCDFAPSRIFKAAWPGLKDTWPAAHQILTEYTLTTDQQQPLMGMVDVDGNPVEEVVAGWLSENESVWKPIVEAAVN